jgi:OmpA-OmpF porin, OOP family
MNMTVGKQRMLIWKRFAVYLCLAVMCIGPRSAAQVVCPPDWPPAGLPADLPCPEEHSDTLQLEHEDRIARLKRLSVGDVQPSFLTDYLSPSEHRLSGYPVNIPVLRVSFDTDVFFDTGKSEIRPEAFPVLRIIAENLEREPPDVALYIVGHTDSVGNEDYNYNLGMTRANAVAEALARRGIYQADIYRLSLGEGYPIDTNTTEAGRAHNRRVEFLFAATSRAAEIYVEKIAVSPCIAKDENGVETCKRPVYIEIKSVAVDPAKVKQVADLNRAEAELEGQAGLSQVELNARREEIELQRKRIPIVPQRSRVAVIPLRGNPAGVE